MKLDSQDRSHLSTNIRPTCEPSRAVIKPRPFLLKRILIPLDFSECSKKAVLYAVPFAGQFHVQMIFLHVVPVNYSARIGQDGAVADPLIDGDTRRQLENRLAEMVRENVPAEVSARLLVRYGFPAIEIMNAAKECEADMIIMATHGHTGRAHSLAGSVSSDVTRLAPCPVLVVHQQEREYMTGSYDPRVTHSRTMGYATTTGTA